MHTFIAFLFSFSQNGYHIPEWISTVLGRRYFGFTNWEEIRQAIPSHASRRLREFPYMVFPLRADESSDFSDRLSNETLCIRAVDRAVLSIAASTVNSSDITV